jgi:hypothetical protein
MANVITVLLKFDNSTDAAWLGMFDEKAIKPHAKQEIANIVIITLRVKGYALTDHQFIQLTLDIHGSEVILQFPRMFFIGIVETKNPEKLGF